jgi:hypothetical protein
LATGKAKPHRNFAQRLKDKAIGTKEERKEAKRKRIEQERVCTASSSDVAMRHG